MTVIKVGDLVVRRKEVVWPPHKEGAVVKVKYVDGEHLALVEIKGIWALKHFLKVETPDKKVGDWL